MLMLLGTAGSSYAFGPSSAASAQARTRVPPQSLKTRMILKLAADATGVTWSRDGARFAAYSDFGRVITVWRTDGTVEQTLHRAVSYVDNSIAFLPNGSQLVTPAADDSGTRAGTALSVLGLDGSGAVLDVPGPARGRPVQYNRALRFALSPSGDEIAVITSLLPDQPVTIYDTVSWTKSAVLLVPKAQSAFNVGWSPDGGTVAISLALGEVLLFNREKLDAPHAFHAFVPPPTTSAFGLAFSPDGSLLALGAGLVIGTPTAKQPLHCLKVWRSDGSAVVGTFEGRYEPIRQLAWHPDGKRIALACGDRAVRVVALDGSPTMPLIFESKFDGAIMGLEFSPDGRNLAAAIHNTITLFDFQS